jgi:hypothetical protein
LLLLIYNIFKIWFILPQCLPGNNLFNFYGLVYKVLGEDLYLKREEKGYMIANKYYEKGAVRGL